LTPVPVIQVEGLWSRFGQTTVHRNVSFEVCSGEVLGIVGGSGSGKTTMLRQMLGLETPVKGRIKIFGRCLAEVDGEERHTLLTRSGVLFQAGALFSALSVFDNVALPLRELRVLPEEVIRELVTLKLALVGIEPKHADKLPAELSGGMVKRVGLARALALEPELLFLDEPTAGLDPDRSDAIMKLIRVLRNELSLTVVMVTHDLESLLQISDRIAVLADQHLVAIGPVRDVIAHEHPFIRSLFFGERGARVVQALRSSLPVV
jgi:phospholipid/cholesterol/gamma-HCH transport system ATP-binding protein